MCSFKNLEEIWKTWKKLNKKQVATLTRLIDFLKKIRLALGFLKVSGNFSTF